MSRAGATVLQWQVIKFGIVMVLHRHIARIGLAAILVAASGLAAAQPAGDLAAPVFLTSAEVRDALVDKPWTGSRGVYGAMTRISYRSDKTIEIVNVDTSTTRKGRWDLDDHGQMCITWSTTTPPSCYLYARSGSRLIAYESTDKVKPHAELIPKRSPQ